MEPYFLVEFGHVPYLQQRRDDADDCDEEEEE